MPRNPSGIAAISRASGSSAAYRQAISRAGGRVVGHAKDFKRSQMSFVVRIHRAAADEPLAREIAAIPDGLRGTPDWHL